MGLFDKKSCDICNGKIGLLGNRKLADGNLCKDCARLLSPFMTDRRQSSVEEIRQHLTYREENKKQVEAFTPTRILGNTTKVYLDENSQRFLVTRQRDWRDGNPDIVPLSQVIECQLEVKEDKKELYQQNAEGKKVSYDPPRYECKYRFDITIPVNSPYFDTIAFELSDERPDSPYTDAYRELERQADELRRALKPVAGAAPAAQQAPQSAPEADTWVCACGATNPGKFCMECGAKKPEGPARCASCGHQPQTQTPPKFCPECGTPFGG